MYVCRGEEGKRGRWGGAGKAEQHLVWESRIDRRRRRRQTPVCVLSWIWATRTRGAAPPSCARLRLARREAARAGLCTWGEPREGRDLCLSSDRRPPRADLCVRRCPGAPRRAAQICASKCPRSLWRSARSVPSAHGPPSPTVVARLRHVRAPSSPAAGAASDGRRGPRGAASPRLFTVARAIAN